MSQELLEVRDLRVDYHRRGQVVHAVQGLNFSVGRGEVFGIVGESGCGKTATVRSLIRLLPSRVSRVRGQIMLEGKDLQKLSEAEMRRVRGRQISMVFQDPMTALNPVLRIGEQIEEGLRAQGGGLAAKSRHARAAEMLELVGVPAPERRLRQFPHEFSGGMRQRVLIAIALACRPKLLLADEPTTALDVTMQAQILALVKRLQGELDMGVILVSHNLAVVAQMCERVAVMYAGRIVEIGAVRDLLASPKHPYTAGLMRCLPASQPRKEYLKAIPGGPPGLTEVSETCSFQSRCDLAERECEIWQAELLDAGGAGHSSRCRRWPEVAL